MLVKTFRNRKASVTIALRVPDILTFYESNQQDALYRLIYFSKSALHVSGDIFTHHQEYVTVFTVCGSVYSSCCRLVSWMSWNGVTNKMQLYRLTYYSKSALRASGDVFVHHQEHLAVFTVSGSVQPSCCRLPAGRNLGKLYQIR